MARAIERTGRDFISKRQKTVRMIRAGRRIVSRRQANCMGVKSDGSKFQGKTGKIQRREQIMSEREALVKKIIVGLVEVFRKRNFRV